MALVPQGTEPMNNGHYLTIVKALVRGYMVTAGHLLAFLIETAFSLILYAGNPFSVLKNLA